MTLLKRPDGIAPQDLAMSRRAVGALFFAGYAAAAFSAAAEPIHTDDGGLITDAVALPTKDFALPAYIARTE